jgi:hypothetical protein
MGNNICRTERDSESTRRYREAARGTLSRTQAFGRWGERLMPADNLLLLATELRLRAEEILARVEWMHDADARQMLRGIAAGYEKLAQRIEQSARQGSR